MAQQLGRFFRNVVAAWQRVASDVIGEMLPFGDRIEALFDHAFRAPQREKIAGDLLALRQRFAIMFQVDRHARAIVLADAMSSSRLLQAAQIFRVCLGRERLQPRTARADGLLQIQVGVRANQRLGERRGTDQEKPVPISASEFERGFLVHRERWRYVKRDQLLDGRRMIQRHPHRHPAAAIVCEHRERFVTQRAHQVDLILRHTALRIVAVIGKAFWFATVAITAQIRGHDGEVFRQFGHDLVPDCDAARPA